MIYKGKGFVDTSRVLDGYVLYQADNSGPSFLQSEISQTNIEKTRKSKMPPVYSQSQVFWVDSFSSVIERTISDLFGNFLMEWEESLSQLTDFVREDVNPEIEKPSSHSIFTALGYLFAIYQIQPELCPELAMSGEGGIYIECQVKDKFVSLQIDRESTGKDRIYIEQGNNYGSTKLTEESIKEAFSG